MSILFVLTSHSLFLDGTHPTGWYAPEAAHPYKEVTEAGFKVKHNTAQYNTGLSAQ